MSTRMQVALGIVAAVFTVATPAWASFAGENGRIVFQSNRHGGAAELYSMNPDATDVRRLTWNTAVDRLPRFSADGSRIVFARNVTGIDQDIWIMNADGTGERRLTSGTARDDAPVFTGDGDHVVFQRVEGPVACPCELRIIGADGTGERLLATGPGNAVNPDVSANGKLAFASDRDGPLSIYVGNLRGGPVKRVTKGPAAFGDFRPRWSPRGNDLVFMRDDGTSLNDIYTVHADGTDLRQLTSGPRFEEQAQWSPDGERIVFAVFDNGSPFGSRLHTIAAIDGGDERLVPQFAAPYVDRFEDGRDDTSVWHTLFSGTGVSRVESGGRVVMSVAADAVPFDGPGFRALETHYGSQCSFSGDYAISVDYELLAWPASNGFQTALASFFSDDFIWRESRPWGEHYFAFADGGFGGVPTADQRGSLRIERSNGVLTASYVANGNWARLLTSTSSGDAVVGFQLADFNFFTGKAVSAAFDNFRLESGELTCPGWWRDSAPDWAASAGTDAVTGTEAPVAWNPFADFRRAPTQANPSGVWSYMWSDGLAHDPSRYQLLPHYSVTDTNREQWDDPASINLLVGHLAVEGGLVFHSYGGTVVDYGRRAILAWTSPVTGDVTIAGNVRLYPLALCGVGSGIVWSVDRGATTLESITLPAGGAAPFDVTTPVRKGETLYFGHDPGFDSDCDTAFVDLRIVEAD